MLIAVDGYDCSGKTTLCRGLAQRLRGRYCRPFDRATSIAMVEAWRQSRWCELARMAEFAITRFLETCNQVPTPVICDRWILSARALMGDDWLPPQHQPLNLQIVCDVDASTYRMRQRARGEDVDRSPEPLIERYRVLAATTGAVVLNSCILDADTMLQKAADAFQSVCRDGHSASWC